MDIDQQVWRVARKAVHKQGAAEFETRSANVDWQRKKDDIGNYTSDQVWQTNGDPIYSQGWTRTPAGPTACSRRT